MKYINELVYFHFVLQNFYIKIFHIFIGLKFFHCKKKKILFELFALS